MLYWKTVWGTSFVELAGDLVACIEEVRKREGQDPVIVAHSSGGGLTQCIVSKGLVKVRALALVGAVPHWGNMVANWNWFRRIDPWFSIRMILYLDHPNSPMSSPRLGHSAFFDLEYPSSRVPEFMKWMSNRKAMWWPFSTAGRGWSIENRTWLDAADTVKNISHWHGVADKLMVMMGTEDKIMKGTESWSVQEYREAIARLRRDKRVNCDANSGEEVGEKAI